VLGALQVANSFAAPIATQQLLKYLETGGKESLLQPWVWILWLGFGPALASIAHQGIFWIVVSVEAQRLAVPIERAVITQS
jgi:hypothetical protein